MHVPIVDRNTDGHWSAKKCGSLLCANRPMGAFVGLKLNENLFAGRRLITINNQTAPIANFIAFHSFRMIHPAVHYQNSNCCWHCV